MCSTTSGINSVVHRLLLPAIISGIALMPTSAVRVTAATDLDLSDRIQVDGFTSDFAPGEAVFGTNPDGVPQESTSDSQWGPFNDVNQIQITWDASRLYLAVDGFIWDNNTILLVDITDRDPASAADDGLTSMTELNSWRRNFIFSEDFTPDFFVATWDGNTLPQIWTYAGVDQVTQVATTSYLGVATFSQSASGRAMEVGIPWSVVFFGQSDSVAVPELGPDAGAWRIPDGMDTLRFAAVITAGPDGTGGPDSAPDNFGGHTVEASDQVTIDNFVIVPLDLPEAGGGDAAEGFPDFGIEPRDRRLFKQTPPIKGVTFDIADIILNRPVVSPEENRELEFSLALDPPADQAEPFRKVTLSATIFDLLGNEVDVLYADDVRSIRDLGNPGRDRWDGRDFAGRMVDGGIYILSVVSEPGLSRAKKAFAVVR